MFPTRFACIAKQTVSNDSKAGPIGFSQCLVNSDQTFNSWLDTVSGDHDEHLENTSGHGVA